MQLKYFLAASAASLSLACGLASAPVAAQQITTGIEGTVTDDSGNPLTGAQVTVTDTRTGATRTLTTDANGVFTASNLTTGGPYTVAATADGFEGQTISEINTTLQGNTGLNFSLTSGSGAIVVTSSRVRVTQLAVGPGQSFNAEVLANAPSFNRDIRDVIRIDPRVSLDRDDGGTSGQDRISCLGGNDRGNALTVDGISQGDIYGLNDNGFASRSSAPIPYDAVRETQVVFAPFDVQYGAFTGCAINMVTKSGSNAFHGSAFYEYGDNGMRGEEVSGIAVAPIKPDKHWGATLGGFIIPDRLFFFGGYEHQEAGRSQDEGPAGAGFAVPITQVTVEQFNAISAVLRDVYGIDPGPLVTSRDYKNDRYFGRLDFQINDRHRLEATYQHLEESSVNPDDQARTGTFGGTVVGGNTFFLSGTKSDYYSARLYSDWTDNISTELYYSKSDIQDLQDPVGGGEAQSDNPLPRIVVGIDNPGTAADGAVEAGPGFSRSSNDLKTSVDQYRMAVTAIQGDHKIKFGFEWNHQTLFNLFVQNATGTLVFQNIDALRNGIVSPGTTNSTTNSPGNAVSGAAYGVFGNFSATGDINDAAASFERDVYSIYLQDEFAITDRLNATVGVRHEVYQGSAPERNANFIARYGQTNAVGFDALDPVLLPRLALNYDMDDFMVFGRPTLRGGVGMFNGGDPLVWFGNVFQNDGSSFGLGTSKGPGCPAQVVVVTNGKYSGLPACVSQQGITQAARGLGNTQSIDPNIKMPTVLRANIGFASELNFTDTGPLSGWNIALDYIYSKYMNPFNLMDLSQTPDLRRGVNGYTIDGRPILVAIDPSLAGCAAKFAGNDPVPTYTGLTAANIAACVPPASAARFDELRLTNAESFDSHLASILLSKNFDRGIITEGGNVFFSVGYAYTDSKDRRNMYNSTAGSNYDNTAAYDRQNPAASRGFFNSKHNVTASLQFGEEFFPDLATRLGLTFVARSGRPYSLTFTGGGIFANTNSGFENALVYLPTGPSDPNIAPVGLGTSNSNAGAIDTLLNFANSMPCAKKYIGQTIPRNTCSLDWYVDLDLNFSQELPGPGHFFGVDDKIKVFASFDNFLNLLNSEWNVQTRRNFAGLQDIAGVSSAGVDAQGRYIITNTTGLTTFGSDEFVNISSSVWRLKVGVSYEF